MSNPFFTFYVSQLESAPNAEQGIDSKVSFMIRSELLNYVHGKTEWLSFHPHGQRGRSPNAQCADFDMEILFQFFNLRSLSGISVYFICKFFHVSI